MENYSEESFYTYQPDFVDMSHYTEYRNPSNNIVMDAGGYQQVLGGASMVELNDLLGFQNHPPHGSLHSDVPPPTTPCCVLSRLPHRVLDAVNDILPGDSDLLPDPMFDVNVAAAASWQNNEDFDLFVNGCGRTTDSNGDENVMPTASSSLSASTGRRRRSRARGTNSSIVRDTPFMYHNQQHPRF